MTATDAVSNQNISYRPGTAADSYQVFLLFEETLADLAQRQGQRESTSFSDPEALARMWKERQPVYEHLALTSDQFWIAEQDGHMLGYGRSIIRDGLQELTELFVLPKAQSSGVGRVLMERAFPQVGINNRSIISSPDVRAQNLYMKAGLFPRFPLYYYWRQPEKITVPSDIQFQPMAAESSTMETLAAIDGEILAHRRDVDHGLLMSNRQGFLYLRDDNPIGYGYMGKRNGPFALLDPLDFPAVLAHAEKETAGRYDHFGLEVPIVNQSALAHVLSQGFKLEPFVATLMSSRQFGSFDRYIVTSPPLFL